MVDPIKSNGVEKQSLVEQASDLGAGIYDLLAGFVGSMEFLTAIAVGVAVWGVVSQRQISARKNTLDYITRQESDGDIIKARQTFVSLVKVDGGLSDWAKVENESSVETQAIKIILNEMELISIGIQRGSIDEAMYKAWFKGSVITFWESSASFIHDLRVRTNNRRLYKEFEAMAEWMKGGKRAKRNWFIGKFF
ncbi:DUF4760 domain-containing protein [Pelagibius sp. Alg239-R121]|uniref:DUF4760 domain-containing protein n=1 Tax=Pelagibius sp. Alg239-R121 TaxID=2993448 RepID=UPI0024A6CA6F|nr:DUF4760 domain-containing protein [Pelagibius sp. Alg239-R121]